MPHGVVLEHELACERRIGIERHRRRTIELLVARGRGWRPPRPRCCVEQIERDRFVTSSCSAACPAFIA